MGIYDRDYYRDEPRPWGGGLETPGTLGAMAATIAVFFIQAFTTRPGETSKLLKWGDFQFHKIAAGEVWRIFTAGLIPDPGLFGLILSMIMLYWAGKELERNYGTKAFIAFYILAAWATSAGKLMLGLAGIDTAISSVGISGAIFAVMVLYACLNPRKTILVFFVLPMPIALVVSLLLGFALLSMISDGTKVHAVGVLSGAIFGILFYKLAPGVLNWLHTGRPRRAARPAVRLFESHDDEEAPERNAPVQQEPTAVSPPRSARNDTKVDEQLEAKLDRVLGKVAQFGRASLTPDELEVLQQASEVYKKKRS